MLLLPPAVTAMNLESLCLLGEAKCQPSQCCIDNMLVVASQHTLTDATQSEQEAVVVTANVSSTFATAHEASI